ncbi:phosphatases II [Hanseniaspora valbyensis NRRL Y-1626]|uniref:phosphatidylinositol-3,4,5-trisphosphate 3-phosphatase n=1 Tax=Hanseniaspora valbyensis NRRL Y-1626 TaxID=766949 RepID=A0A1B7TBM8_9ASCO|nr:phosphatases II [Hanseniaspora valbyensis NRRL Y-1626]
MNNNYKEYDNGKWKKSNSFIENSDNFNEEAVDVEDNDELSLNITSEQVFNISDNSNSEVYNETFESDDIDDNFDVKLDLSYISSKIIVCSYPIYFNDENRKLNKSLLYKKFYRNDLKDLVNYFNLKIGRNHWKLFNLKIEFTKSEDYTDTDLENLLSEKPNIDSVNGFHKSRSATLLNEILTNSSNNNNNTTTNINKQKIDKVTKLNTTLPLVRAGWLDHQPPPLLHLLLIVEELNIFLQSDKHNVAIIHCKMGKGRSGCLAVTYLIKKYNLQLNDALELFKKTRFKYGLIKGVTIKSQLRFLRYFEFLNNIQKHENNKSFEMISFFQNLKMKFKLTLFEIFEPNSTFFNFDKEKTIDTNYYFEIKLQTYNENRDGLIDLAGFEIHNKEYDEYSTNINEETKYKFIKSFINSSDDITLTCADIKISFCIKSIKYDSIINSGSSFFKKNSGLTASFWINLYVETTLNSQFINHSDFYKYENLCIEQSNRSVNGLGNIILSFDECDNLSDTIGLFSSSVNIWRLFERFEMSWQIV